MPAKQRRNARPNRGGGQFNRSRGGGGGQGRKAFDIDDLMDGPVLEGPGREGRGSSGKGQRIQPTGQPSRYGRGGQSGTASRGRDATSTGFSSRTKEPKVKVQMQHLHMTTENQQMVRDTLKSLHGDDHSIPSDNEYDELDTRGDDHYWQTERPLFVDSAHPYALTAPPVWVSDERRVVAFSEELKDSDVNPAAMQKLQRCGFSRQLCEEALQVCDGDVGAALEYMLTELRALDLPLVASGTSEADISSGGREEIPQHILELRSDEKFALECIYEHRFEERIANRVWILHLDLPELKQMLNFNVKADSLPAKAGSSQKVEEICKFYRKGNCRFGVSCRQLHSAPAESEVKKQTEDLQGPLADNLFSLEIRFPAGNSYPLEVPLIAFSSVIDRLPSYTCLNISRFLMRSAQQWTETQSPSIYSLVPMLEDRDQLRSLLDTPPPPTPFYSLSALPSLVARQPQVKTDSPRDKSSQVKTDSPRDRSSQVKTDSPRDRSSQVQRGHKDSGGQSERTTRMYGGSERAQRSSTSDEPSHATKIIATGFAVREGPIDHDTYDGIGDAGPKHSSGRHFLPHEMKTNSVKDSSSNVLKQNKKLKDEFKKKLTSVQYKKRLEERRRLPAWAEQDKVLTCVQENQVVVISGMTGCGKTTQVPQFIFDNYLFSRDLHLCNIVCTQPRRISAIAVAQRVADERVEKLGNSVGYQIRLENVMSAATRLLFCTTGIILRRLEGDPTLSDVTHVIVDEVHERSEESDFLLMVLRDLLPERPDLKVILMSATLNAELFSAYFGSCPIVEIPGKTFPVEAFFLEDVIEMTRYVLEENSPNARSQKKQGQASGNRQKVHHKGAPLSYSDAIEESLMGLSLDGWTEDDEPSDKKSDERLSVKELAARYSDYSKGTIRTLALMDIEKINYDLILELMLWIVSGDHEFPKGGAVLIFLPGFAEIQQLLDMMLSSSEFGHRNKAKYKIVPLHSSLSTEEQNSVFAKPREGVTKIVVATNIAETSITIDDIVFVVDAGRMKEKRYDSALSMESLETVWVSRANAVQRRGRAGRVTSGVCFHLFTGHHFEHLMREQPVPEIQRAPLEQLMLRILMLEVFKNRDPRDILLNVVEPPAEDAMENAMKRLQDVGAIDEDENLTALGYHLGTLPVDVRIGKLMLMGSIFCCLDSALTIAAALSFKSPFVSPFGKKTEADEKKKEFAVGNSDYLTILNAYKQWLSARTRGHQGEYNFCQENFLSFKTLQMLASLKQQYVELLSDIGFTKSGLRLRNVQRLARESATDGIVEATGPEVNANTKNWKLISAILVGALYPNVVQVMTPQQRYAQSAAGAVARAPKSVEMRFVTKSDGDVHVHPSSVNYQVRHFESPYLVYHEKVKTSKVFIRDCTMVSVYSLLLFAGNHISIELDHGNLVLSVDEGWIRFKASSGQVAELLRELRQEMDKLLEDKIKSPNMDLPTCPRGSRIIDTIVKLITTQ